MILLTPNLFTDKHDQNFLTFLNVRTRNRYEILHSNANNQYFGVTLP